jgi:hypothetical protein
MIDGDVSRGSVQDGVSSNVIVEEGLQGRGIGEVSDTCDMVLATVSVERTPQNAVEIGHRSERISIHDFEIPGICLCSRGLVPLVVELEDL